MIWLMKKPLVQAVGPSARPSYNDDWKKFQIWCAENGKLALPSDVPTVAGYLAHLATVDSQYRRLCSVDTIGRCLAAIAYFHHECSAPDPTKHAILARLLEGIRRDQAGRRMRKPSS